MFDILSGWLLICLGFNTTVTVIPLVCISRVSSESLEEIKLVAIFNWMFHSLWVLWLSIKRFKNVLTLSR